MVKLRPEIPGAAGALPLRAPVRVLVVDDHPLFAKTLEAMLAGDHRIEVVGHAPDGKQGLELAAALDPDVILMDLDMPIMGGFEATRRLLERGSTAQVLVMTASESPDDSDRALAEGAVGYLTKDRVAVELLPAILQVARAASIEPAAAPAAG